MLFIDSFYHRPYGRPDCGNWIIPIFAKSFFYDCTSMPRGVILMDTSRLCLMGDKRGARLSHSVYLSCEYLLCIYSPYQNQLSRCRSDPCNCDRNSGIRWPVQHQCLISIRWSSKLSNLFIRLTMSTLLIVSEKSHYCSLQPGDGGVGFLKQCAE